jgi:hypothetical protein
VVDRSPPSLAIDYISCVRSFGGWPGGRSRNPVSRRVGVNRVPDLCYRLAVIPIAVVIAAVIVVVAAVV